MFPQRISQFPIIYDTFLVNVILFEIFHVFCMSDIVPIPSSHYLFHIPSYGFLIFTHNFYLTTSFVIFADLFSSVKLLPYFILTNMICFCIFYTFYFFFNNYFWGMIRIRIEKIAINPPFEHLMTVSGMQSIVNLTQITSQNSK